MSGARRGVGIGEVLPVNEEVIEVGEEDEVLDAEDVEPMRVLPTPVLHDMPRLRSIGLITGRLALGAMSVVKCLVVSVLTSRSPRESHERI